MAEYEEAQKLKITLKNWESEFVSVNKRKPKKEDIDQAPQQIQDTYKDYNRLKKQIQNRIDQKERKKSQDDHHDTSTSQQEKDSNSVSPKQSTCTHENSPNTLNTSNTVNETSKDSMSPSQVSNGHLTSPRQSVPAVWGREFDRKKSGAVSNTHTSTPGAKKPCDYLKSLSSKLFDSSKKIGNAKPSFRRSEPVVRSKSTPNKQDINTEERNSFCDKNSNEEFKFKNEMFEKAVSFTSKKGFAITEDEEKVIIHDQFRTKPKTNLSGFSKSFCDSDTILEYDKTFGTSVPKKDDFDEVDSMQPFVDESNRTENIIPFEQHKQQENSPENEMIGKRKRQPKIHKNPSDNEEPMDTEPCHVSPQEVVKTKKSSSKRSSNTKSQKTKTDSFEADNDVDKEDKNEKNDFGNKFEFEETDDIAILPKYGKRKAEPASGPSKKRKIKVVEEEDGDGDDDKTEKENALRRPKAPARSRPSASASSSENFVRLNMKVKTYKRKGKKGMTGPQMRRFQWKQKMKARSQSFGNKCFKCGQEGHWANKCTGAPKNKEEMDDKPPVIEENFPTLKQATMMAKGVKLDTKSRPKRAQEECAEMREEEPTEEDFDDLDVEAGVVRNKRETMEPPPPMEPFFSAEEATSTELPDSVKKGLKKFGYEKFRHGQQQAVMRILSGQSTLVIISTGGGKSLTYQLPAVLYAEKKQCFTLVISPLVSLMEDQITGLPPGVRGACLHTNMTKAQRESVVESVKEGKVHFLLVSPEAVAGGTMSILTSTSNLPPISFVCIDEAHCLSEWSHNFRPSYLRLTKVLRERFGVRCFLGLTATATQSTAADVAKHLGIDDLEEAVVRGPPVPKNLLLSVSRDENRDEALIGLLRGDRFSGCESIILYCTRRDTTDRLATLIRTTLQDEKGENWTGDRTKRKGGKKQYNYWDTESYHAGLSPAARKRVQNAFMSGRLRVVVATVAFGMGLDKSNVRGVIHYNMPKSFESYVQEIGRAGRDGKPSHCHVFLEHEGKDLNELRRHTYSNTVDYRTIKKFVRRVFAPCKCREVHERHKEAIKGEDCDNEDKELFDDWDGTDDSSTKHVCPGHERAIPIESFVMELDVKEEELHPEETWKLENLTNVYSTCSIQCYGGPSLLQGIAKKCPPVAVAIAKAKKDGKTFADKTKLDFDIIEISDCMGWDSGPVKRELKMLMWDMSGVQGPRRTGVMVEFTDLAFHYRAPGDLTEDEIDDVIMALHNRIQKQEKSELHNLRYLFNTLQSVSHKNYWMCADDLDEKKNAKLKAILEDYFQEQTDFKQAVLEETDQELSSYELNQVLSDIRQFINMYSHEHKLTGRAIARVFHGVASPCFPATTWGRVRRFWRSNMNVDFNLIIKLATKELVQMR